MRKKVSVYVVFQLTCSLDYLKKFQRTKSWLRVFSKQWKTLEVTSQTSSGIREFLRSNLYRSLANTIVPTSPEAIDIPDPIIDYLISQLMSQSALLAMHAPKTSQAYFIFSDLNSEVNMNNSWRSMRENRDFFWWWEDPLSSFSKMKQSEDKDMKNYWI